MYVKIETIASIVAIVISIGTIFYHGIVVKRDVEHLTIKSDKREERFNKINQSVINNEKEIHSLQSHVIFNKDKVNEINKYLTEINKRILESSEETRKLLLQKSIGLKE